MGHNGEVERKRGRRFQAIFGRVSLYSLSGLVVLASLVVALAPLGSSDTFFHIEAGRLIHEEGPYLEEEPFLLQSEGPGPVFPAWLSALALFGAYSKGGYLGVRMLSGVLAGITLLVLRETLPGRTRGPYGMVLGLLVGGLLMLPVLDPVPELFGLPLLLLGFVLLCDSPHRVPLTLVAAVFLLTALATNLHPGMAAAFVVLSGALLILRLPRAFVSPMKDASDPAFSPALGWKWWGNQALVFAAGAAGFLANPWHVHLPAALWSRYRWLPVDPIWQPPPGETLSAVGWGVLGGAALAVALLIVNLAAGLLGTIERGQRPPAFTLALCALLAGLCAVLSRGHLWLLFFPLLAALHAESPLSASIEERPRRRPVVVRTVAVVLLLLCAGFEPRYREAFRLLSLPEDYLSDLDADILPVDAARFITEAGMAGPVFCEPRWSGYLVHALPGTRVLVDKRTWRIPGHILEASADVLGKTSDAGRILEHYDVELALLRADRASPGVEGQWSRVFRNRVASIYLHRSPQTLDQLVRASRYYRSISLPQRVAERFEEAVVLEGNPEWASEFRILPEGIQEQVLRLYQEMRISPSRDGRVIALRRLGNIYAWLGLYDSALREWDRGLQIRGRDRNLLYNIGVAQLKLGRREEARRTFQSFHVLYPEDSEVEKILQALDHELAY